MQELLGRIARLDPTASLGLRVIACFDELVVGNVNTRALLSAAASLSGCTAGFAQDHPARTMRISPRGRPVEGPAPLSRTTHAADACGDLTVWLEREGRAGPNDAIVLERLALAVRIRHGRGRGAGETHRDLGILVGDAPEADRLVAASALGLEPGRRHRIAAAPLFAVWEAHPAGPEDVVPTRFGPIHAMVLPDTAAAVQASPVGIGVAAAADGLQHSFRTALVALRLCEPPTTPVVRADDFGGLVDLLADAPDDSPQHDADLLETVAGQPWVLPTVDALVRASSVRQASRLAGVHHSTLQARLTSLAGSLGFDPADGLGRSRLVTAYLVWRLRHSTVLDLPAPAASRDAEETAARDTDPLS